MSPIDNGWHRTDLRPVTLTNFGGTFCNCPLDMSVANWVGPRPVKHNESCPPAQKETTPDRGEGE